MNKILSLIAIISSAAWLNHRLNAELYAVQAGELTLRCVINDETRTIAPNQVVGLLDGVWIFEKGHARNCEVIKMGDL